MACVSVNVLGLGSASHPCGGESQDQVKNLAEARGRNVGLVSKNLSVYEKPS
jgi:hypothetical protein